MKSIEFACFSYLESDAEPKTIVRNDIKGRLLTPEEGCGHTDVAHTRIVGGSAAKKGAWPFMALLGKYYSKQYKIYTFHCGESTKDIFLLKKRHSNKMCIFEPHLKQVDL